MNTWTTLYKSQISSTLEKGLNHTAEGLDKRFIVREDRKIDPNHDCMSFNIDRKKMNGLKTIISLS